MDLQQAESHAIVETEDKKWIDVSPHDGHAEILFLLQKIQLYIIY